MPSGRQQLEMVRGPAPVPVDVAVPPRYVLRMARSTDSAAYDHLFATTFDEPSPFNALMERSLRNGFFVVEDSEGGALVASAAAALFPRERYSEGASLQWVAADPAHRGRGLGLAVCAAATVRLAEAGYDASFLTTDDFRLPAIKIYLGLGWKPSLFAPDMESRWQKVFAQLGLIFDPVRSVL